MAGSSKSSNPPFSPPNPNSSYSTTIGYNLCDGRRPCRAVAPFAERSRPARAKVKTRRPRQSPLVSADNASVRVLRAVFAPKPPCPFARFCRVAAPAGRRPDFPPTQKGAASAA